MRAFVRSLIALLIYLLLVIACLCLIDPDAHPPVGRVLLWAAGIGIPYGLVCAFLFSRTDPDRKIDRVLLPLLRERLTTREPLPISRQIPDDLKDYELAIFMELVQIVARALDIKTDQLRLGERLIDVLAIEQNHLPDAVRDKWIAKSRRRDLDYILPPVLLFELVESLMTYVGKKRLQPAGLDNEVQFDDYLLFSPLGSVLQRLTYLRLARPINKRS